MLSQSVPTRGVPEQGAVAVAANVAHNAANRRCRLRQVGRAPLLQRTHESIPLRTIENTHHITTLLSGYSTIPCALACLSLCIRDQAACSSITVLTATHSPSAKGATVGFCSAGSSPSTAERSGLGTLSIRPTLPCAAIAPQSITAKFSILRRRSGSAHALLLAMSCVLDSRTVSRIRK